VNARSATGQTPLHRVVRKGYERASALVRWLLAQGAAVDAADRQGRTALHLVVQRADLEMIELLIQSGADPNAPDRDGRVPLWYGIQLKSLPVVKRLLDLGADPDAQPMAWPLLYWGIREEDLELVRCFLDHGADPNIVWNRDWTPLFAAAFHKNLELARLLLAYGAKVHVQVGSAQCPKPLLGAAMRRQPAILQELLEHGADPNLADPIDGITALVYAIVNDDADCVRLLLEAGANPLQPCGVYQETPLNIAVEQGKSDIERLLREAIAAET
jgi:ankyrin repeat protein